jgi:peptidoglycan/xylan/chitin deacetylase (PgdA/CDA1 family)
MDDGSAMYSRQDEIMEILKKYNISGGFAVNEGSSLNQYNKQELYDNLKKYLLSGHVVFNHTYLHSNVEKETFEEFQQDVLKGERILNIVLKENDIQQSKYFRFPFLRVGESEEKRAQIKDFLEKNGYIILPITIDTRDWEVERAYMKSVRENNKEKIDKISSTYIEYIESEIEKTEKWSCELLGRNPKHILLTHAKNITVDNLENIIKVFHKKGYKFISVDDAMKDKIYHIDFMGPKSLSVGGVLSKIEYDRNNQK